MPESAKRVSGAEDRTQAGCIGVAARRSNPTCISGQVHRCAGLLWGRHSPGGRDCRQPPHRVHLPVALPQADQLRRRLQRTAALGGWTLAGTSNVQLQLAGVGCLRVCAEQSAGPACFWTRMQLSHIYTQSWLDNKTLTVRPISTGSCPSPHTHSWPVCCVNRRSFANHTQLFSNPWLEPDGRETLQPCPHPPDSLMAALAGEVHPSADHECDRHPNTLALQGFPVRQQQVCWAEELHQRMLSC